MPELQQWERLQLTLESKGHRLPQSFQRPVIKSGALSKGAGEREDQGLALEVHEQIFDASPFYPEFSVAQLNLKNVSSICDERKSLLFAKSLTLQCTFQSWVSFGPHGRQQNSVTDFILDVWY